MTAPSRSNRSFPRTKAGEHPASVAVPDSPGGWWRPFDFLVAMGGMCVVLGGLVAAATGPWQLGAGSWLAAYLVLVGGAAQYAIGRAPVVLGVRSRTANRTGWSLLATWNLGNGTVIAGTLVELASLVDAGSGVLLAGVVLAWRMVPRPSTERRACGPRLAGWAFRGMLVVLFLSIPIGVALAHL